MAQVAVGLRSHIDVFGNDYATPDGTGVRDYLHVVDLARGHLLALQKIEESVIAGETRIYNLGTGKGYSVLDMIAAFAEATRRPIPYRNVARRPGDVSTLIAEVSKAERELGFKCQYSLKEMCEHLWNWQSHNPHGYPTNMKHCKPMFSGPQGLWHTCQGE